MGFGKYGRAEDSGGVIVRHIPIIIEGQDTEDEIATDTDDRNETQLYPNSTPVNLVKVPIVSVRANNHRKFGGQRYDRSSTSSTESENSVDISNSKRRSEDLTRKWQRLKGCGNNNNSDSSNINSSNFSGRTPLNEVTQKRHTLASARKSSNPKYVVIQETIGLDHCPIHGNGHHHHHHDHHEHHEHHGQDHHDSRGIHSDKNRGIDRQKEVHSDQLKAPELLRKTSIPQDEDFNFEKKKAQTTLQKGRPKHSNPSLAPIKKMCQWK